jgi:hypothetical protein
MIFLWIVLYGSLVWADMRFLSAILDLNTVTLVNISSGLAVILFQHFGTRLVLPLTVSGALGHGLAAIARIESVHLITGLLFGACLTLTHGYGKSYTLTVWTA